MCMIVCVCVWGKAKAQIHQSPQALVAFIYANAQSCSHDSTSKVDGW